MVRAVTHLAVVAVEALLVLPVVAEVTAWAAVDLVVAVEVAAEAGEVAAEAGGADNKLWKKK